MGLLWMILLLVLVQTQIQIQAQIQAQNLTEVRGELGGNTTLTCSLNISQIHWYLEVYRGFRACIGRTFSSDSANYCSPGFESKYLMEFNRLVIKNMTAEDSRLYLCGRRNESGLHFMDSFNLTLNLNLTSETQTNQSRDPSDQTVLTRLVLYGSLGLNAVLLLAVTGLICVNCVRSKTRSQQEAGQTPFPCENPQTVDTVQYEEIQLPPHRAPPPECIYYKAQHPAAMPRPR